MKLKTLPMDPPTPVVVTLRGQLTCRCPVNERRDYATVEVSYSPEGWLIELASFAAYLGSFAERAMTHEAATAEIAATVREATRADARSIRTEWAPVEGIGCTVEVVA